MKSANHPSKLIQTIAGASCLVVGCSHPNMETHEPTRHELSSEQTLGQRLSHFRDVVLPSLVPDRDDEYMDRVVYLWSDVPNPYRPPLPLDEEVVPGIMSLAANPLMVGGPYIVDFSLKESDPTIARTAVIILPGGGYSFRAELHEGLEVAEWLNDQGISAFVLNYRLDTHPAPISDARLALAYVRKNAETFGIDPNRLGMLGFSAGGHLAASVATLHDSQSLPDLPPVYHTISTRPDFTILAYPCITMIGPHANSSVVENLLGSQVNPDTLRQMSAQLQVNGDAPPTFIWTTMSDEVVDYQNSVMFANALRENHVETELVLYPEGSHGLGLAIQSEHAIDWPQKLLLWMQHQGLLRRDGVAP